MKKALITGAAIRIGRGIAESMLDDGYHVIVHANSSFDALTQWVANHNRKAQIIGTVCSDLSVEAGQESLCRAVENHTDSLEVLVHNASSFRPEAFPSITRESYRAMQAVNLDAPYFITQSLLPLLKKSKNPSVVNIIDALWERPSPQYSHYSVGKAGLAILTKVLARELAPHIRVNAVAPGAILFQPFHSEETRKETLNKIPLKALGTPSDIGRAVIFAAQSSYMTGEILAIDGGRSLA